MLRRFHHQSAPALAVLLSITLGTWPVFARVKVTCASGQACDGSTHVSHAMPQRACCAGPARAMAAQGACIGYSPVHCLIERTPPVERIKSQADLGSALILATPRANEGIAPAALNRWVRTGEIVRFARQVHPEQNHSPRGPPVSI